MQGGWIWLVVCAVMSHGMDARAADSEAHYACPYLQPAPQLSSSALQVEQPTVELARPLRVNLTGRPIVPLQVAAACDELPVERHIVRSEVVEPPHGAARLELTVVVELPPAEEDDILSQVDVASAAEAGVPLSPIALELPAPVAAASMNTAGALELPAVEWATVCTLAPQPEWVGDCRYDDTPNEDVMDPRAWDRLLADARQLPCWCEEEYVPQETNNASLATVPQLRKGDDVDDLVPPPLTACAPDSELCPFELCIEDPQSQPAPAVAHVDQPTAPSCPPTPEEAVLYEDLHPAEVAVTRAAKVTPEREVLELDPSFGVCIGGPCVAEERIAQQTQPAPAAEPEEDQAPAALPSFPGPTPVESLTLDIPPPDAPRGLQLLGYDVPKPYVPALVPAVELLRLEQRHWETEISVVVGGILEFLLRNQSAPAISRRPTVPEF